MRSIGATSDSSGRFCVIERVMWPYFFIVPDGFTSLVFRLARFWYHSSETPPACSELNFSLMTSCFRRACAWISGLI